MFKGIDFQYDGKSSSDFSLKIGQIGRSGINTEMTGIPLEIEEEKIKRNPKPFFFGVETTPNLKFKLQIFYIPEGNDGSMDKELSRGESGAISKWLFKREYKEFKIIDSDYSNIVYYAMFTNPKKIESSNKNFGYEVDIICDRPYPIRRQIITKTVNGSLTLNIKNLGFDNDYVKPEIEFTTSGNFSIKNITDNNKTMTFTGLSTNETVYVNTERQEIISSTGNNINSKFNFNWFRITPDYYNSIEITGTGTVTFRTEYPMPV